MEFFFGGVIRFLGFFEFWGGLRVVGCPPRPITTPPFPGIPPNIIPHPYLMRVPPISRAPPGASVPWTPPNGPKSSPQAPNPPPGPKIWDFCPPLGAPPLPFLIFFFLLFFPFLFLWGGKWDGGVTGSLWGGANSFFLSFLSLFVFSYFF